jgi:asparagine synthase (glutamine-hydrolysing)
MCGIAGFVDSQFSEAHLLAMQQTLKHRGPDASNHFFDDGIAIAHNRLSIIDLSETANQPFFFKHWILAFNGEIYNYQSVRRELEAHYSFQTNSDTEVLIKGFDHWGVAVLDKLVGMFAFALYHSQTKDLYLVRDRLGVKPLYYNVQKGISFASEVRAFHALPIQLTIDQQSVEDYFRFGYVLGHKTIFRDVFKVRPGHYIHWQNGKAAEKCYWTIPAPADKLTLDEHAATDALEEMLTDAFIQRLVSDVPVGVFLSGGVDSSLVAALLQKNSTKKIRTFTIGFDQFAYDEMPFAKKVAEHIGTEHIDLRLNVTSAEAIFTRFYDIYDEPFSDTSGIPTALVASLAKDNGVKVVLSGDGGDEFFCGYTHYARVADMGKHLERVPNRLRRLGANMLQLTAPNALRDSIWYGNFGHRIDRMQALLLTQGIAQLFEAAISNQSTRSLERLLTFQCTNNERKLPNALSEIEQMMFWDASYFLPDDLLMKVDRATMFHSVEGREPFLDHRVIQFAQHLPLSMKFDGRTNKRILKNILSKYLPSHLIHRPKQGFSIPIFAWFGQQLDKQFDEYFSKDRIDQIGILNYKEVAIELKKYRYNRKHGQQYNMEKMWRLLSFCMWHKRWVK